MRINTNTSAMTSYSALSAVTQALSRSIARLSSGLRINTAADDAAGLAISEKMRAQYRGLDQAERNAQDGISMIRTAEGALNEVHSVLQRMRELSVQAASDTLTQEDRAYVQLEIDQLKEEIDRISNTTQFNRKKLLDGSSDAIWSTDELEAHVRVGGPTDAIGNWRVVVTSTEGGRGQVQKSNVFTRMVHEWYDPDPDKDGDELSWWEKRPAKKTDHLSELTNFFDANGKFILDDPQQLTLSFEGAGSRTITVYSEDTLETLGMKINAALMEASGQHDGGSTVQWIGGAEMGRVIPGNAEPIDIYGDMLMTGLIENSAKLIEDKLGLKGSGTNELSVMLDPGSTRPTSTYYRTANGHTLNDLEMYVGDAFFTDMTDSKWEEAQIAALREVTRAMEYANDHLTGAMFDLTVPGPNKPPIDASWLHEGLIQYIAGGSAVVQAQLGGKSDAEIIAAMNAAVGTGTNTGFSTGADGYSAASYLAARYFDEKSGGRLKDLVGRLAAGDDIDTAIAATSSFANMAAFRATVTGGGTDFTNFVTKVRGEDTTVDGGFLGGQFASGGPAQTRADLAKSLLGDNYKDNPLDGHGFNHFEMYDYSLDTTTISGGGGLLSTSAPKPGTMQSVDGTLLLHSNIAGDDGRISLSGSEDLIKALGFVEIQSAEPTIRTVSIYDAHTGATRLSGVQFSGRTIKGALGADIDIDVPLNFALDVDMSGTLSGGYSTYKFSGATGEFIVHIAESSTVLQIGANQGETMRLSFGETSSRALGVDRVRVTSREDAARAITLTDAAIAAVSIRRAKLGAYQNRLEHTVLNLTEASTNMKASESRIRDLDMAREMMEFTKLNILNQAGSSMLAQANAIPQNILTMLRG